MSNLDILESQIRDAPFSKHIESIGRKKTAIALKVRVGKSMHAFRIEHSEHVNQVTRFWRSKGVPLAMQYVHEQVGEFLKGIPLAIPATCIASLRDSITDSLATSNTNLYISTPFEIAVGVVGKLPTPYYAVVLTNATLGAAENLACRWEVAHHAFHSER